MILSRYLMRAFLGRFVMLLVGLVLFLQTLDLLATANEVLEGGGAPLASLSRYVVLRAPSLVETVAPLAALLGALTAMVGMATNSEILAMRAAGRSVLSLVGGLVSVGLVLSVVLFVFSEFAVVPANVELQNWRDAGFKTAPEEEIQTGENSWIREGSTIIRVGKVLRDGTVLNDVKVFKQDEDGNIDDILNVRLAIWEDDKWSTFEISRVAGRENAPDESTLTWETNLKPEHFNKFGANHPNELSLNALQQYVGTVAIGSRPEYFYDTWFQQKIAGPIVLALMPLLAAIAAFAHHRQGRSVVTIVWGITIGFAFVVVDNIVLAMGQFGSLPPIVAAWLPIALFGTLGLWLIFNLEHTGART
jgi:lipopolysaccharide export system permease protein